MAIVNVVKYNGDPDVFAWKYPNEELSTWTQLIVNESQEAVLFKDGRALDVFVSGRYTLDTPNIPILNKIVNIPFGGKSPFAAEVWFVNKIISLNVKWGTPTPIQVQDPRYKVFIPVRSYGQFGIQIEDSWTFLTKLVGTLPIFDKENISDYFRGFYLTRVKDAISSYLINKQVSVLEINAHLNELSAHLQEKIRPVLSEYGIKLVNFYVNDINVPEDDPAVIKIKAALAKRAEMEIVGYNYAQERSFDALEGAATNPGAGQPGLMEAGIGLGVGMGMNNIFGSQFNELAKNINTSAGTKRCPDCGTYLGGDQRFCGECGCDTLKREKREKTCPKCGAAIDANAKFCMECGEPLVKKCANCHTEIKGTPKFCPECGSKL